MYTQQDFQPLIDWAVKELRIKSVKITWDFQDVYMIPGKAYADVKTNVYAKTARIRVAASEKWHDKHFVANSILHELRHVWQDIKGIMTETWHHGEELDQPVYSWTAQGKQRIRYYGNSYWVHVWKGTEFAEAATWSRMEYMERPNEIDAREWANHAMNQFYGTKFAVNRIDRQLVARTGGMTVYKLKKGK